MNILVDTSVWSLVLRRRSPDPAITGLLRQLVLEGRAKMIGAIRQEILSGVSNETKSALLKARLQAFEDIVLGSAHYEHAAELSNQCRAKGVSGSHTDFLICAVSKLEKLAIFSTDADFDRYSRIVGLALYKGE